MNDDLFNGHYSERRIRFLLGHWDAWAYAGEWPRYARFAVGLTIREWEVLAGDPARDCLCAPLNDGIPSREEFGAACPAGPQLPLLADVRGDLSRATDLLPLHWRATRLIFETEGRVHAWGARLAQHRALGLPRPQEHLLEPPSDPDLPWLRTGGGAACVRMMTTILDGGRASVYAAPVSASMPCDSHAHPPT